VVDPCSRVVDDANGVVGECPTSDDDPAAELIEDYGLIIFNSTQRVSVGAVADREIRNGTDCDQQEKPNEHAESNRSDIPISPVHGRETV